jgi:outer membrane protein assembly factor BamC
MKQAQHLLLAVALGAVLSGCSWFGGGKTDEYKGARARAAQPLEVPPELTAPTIDDRYAVPDPRSQTTYSAYSQKGATAPAVRSVDANTVLPPVQGARLERQGDQRWIVVKGDPAKVWQVVRDFWVESGYPLAREEPNTGIMETEWHDDRSRLPDDLMRRTIGRVVPNIFSTPRRDKFRTRLEKGSEPGTTEIFVSNRQVEEIYTTNNQDRTVWQSRPADPELEAEMLSRLLLKLGADQQQAAAAAAAAKPVAAAPGSTPAASSASPAVNAVLQNNGAGPLVVNDSFDRAWRRVGLALDRVGFTVEDRDRSNGLFFVRYIDPEADLQTGQKEGFLDRLKFWKSTPKSAQPQYRIHVSDAGAGLSHVQVRDAQGAVESSSTGRKILSLLFEQLK